MVKLWFPEEIGDKYKELLPSITDKLPDEFLSVAYADGYDSDNEYYSLSDGTSICFKYRIYFCDDEMFYSSIENHTEKLIYDCVFTRSNCGYTREKHLKRILATDFPEWCMPYILRLSSEYVVEIVECIYKNLITRDNTKFNLFCRNNPRMLKRAYTRMVSYWNEFYRDDYSNFDDYVGTKLFKECLSPHTNFEKL